MVKQLKERIKGREEMMEFHRKLLVEKNKSREDGNPLTETNLRMRDLQNKQD